MIVKSIKVKVNLNLFFQAIRYHQGLDFEFFQIQKNISNLLCITKTKLDYVISTVMENLKLDNDKLISLFEFKRKGYVYLS